MYKCLDRGALRDPTRHDRRLHLDKCTCRLPPCDRSSNRHHKLSHLDNRKCLCHVFDSVNIVRRNGRRFEIDMFLFFGYQENNSYRKIKNYDFLGLGDFRQKILKFSKFSQKPIINLSKTLDG